MVSPSLYEGFGVPLLEAFWSGVPVAASDIPVYREVAEDGAAYFDPREIDQCSQAIYTVCTDEAVRGLLLERAQIRRRVYSWDASAEKLQRIIVGMGKA